jgi:hypothetical protein
MVAPTVPKQGPTVITRFPESHLQISPRSLPRLSARSLPLLVIFQRSDFQSQSVQLVGKFVDLSNIQRRGDGQIHHKKSEASRQPHGSCARATPFCGSFVHDGWIEDIN